MIYTHIPYTPKELGTNLGYAYNKFMEMLPDDDDWGCFLDHDAMFTTSNWYNQIADIIRNNPDVGVFGARTNRIASQHHLVGNIDVNNHDIKYHRRIGKYIQTKWYSDVLLLDSEKTKEAGLSGVVILIQKRIWSKLGGFKTKGFLGVDNDIRYRADEKNVKVGIMNGVYVYHWYRADKPKINKRGSKILKEISRKWFAKNQKKSFIIEKIFLFGNTIDEHLT